MEVDLIKMVRMDGSEFALEGLAWFVGDDMQKTFLGEIEDSGRSDEDGSRLRGPGLQKRVVERRERGRGVGGHVWKLT